MYACAHAFMTSMYVMLCFLRGACYVMLCYRAYDMYVMFVMYACMHVCMHVCYARNHVYVMHALRVTYVCMRVIMHACMYVCDAWIRVMYLCLNNVWWYVCMLRM